jgi:DNA phosphorothioation-associated putative methyltransferase
MKADIGKRVGGALYVHRSAVELLPEAAKRFLSRPSAAAEGLDWNVVRISKKAVTFLLYESFDDVAFPTLLESLGVPVNGALATRTDYRKRANPPILHRKELLLAFDDPRLPKFRALTAAAEEHGLFADSHKIGTRAAWNKRIADAGLVLRGHRIVPAHEEHIQVSRHRTAITRGDLSQPMQLMLRLGMIVQERSVFDYGCGQGQDVAALGLHGYEAFGWDPHHAPEGRRHAADLVNLGFVLNVIEDTRERIETLKAAWSFAKAALCVSVMVLGRSDTRGQQPHRDGFLTSRGTFQKYYAQEELREFVSSATGQAPLSLAPGIVAVFRDKELEQEVLLRRRSRAFAVGELPRPPRPERTAPARPGLRERLASVLHALRGIALALGRLPEPEEVPTDVRADLVDQRVGFPRALDLLRADLSGDEAFAESGRGRREDLLVHMALQQFPGSPKYRSLPRSIQADIRAFFGSQAQAIALAQRLLFSAGDRAGIRADAETAVASGLGGLRGTSKFRFLSSTLPRLPARLRILVGCAEVLQGGVAGCDLVDLDLEASRVTMISCDDINNVVPFITERIKVDLARQKVFADRREPETAPIYFKSRFLPRDHAGYQRQVEFDSAVAATGLFDPPATEPKWATVKAALRTTVNLQNGARQEGGRSC